MPPVPTYTYSHNGNIAVISADNPEIACTLLSQKFKTPVKPEELLPVTTYCTWIRVLAEAKEDNTPD